MEKPQYFHLCADGDDAKNFIVSEEDFLAATNLIGVCAANTNVKVVAFNIEDSHPHILLFGYYSDCIEFKDKYQTSYCHHIVESRGSLDDVVLDIVIYPIENQEYLENAGTYVLVQPTKDGKNVMPYDYKWGSGCLYFRNVPYVAPWYFDDNGNISTPVRVDCIPVNERKSILFSRQEVPGDWLVCNGILLPSNYVDVERFESIYGSYNRFRVFLSSSKLRDEPIRNKLAEVRGVRFETIEARRLCGNTCAELFGFRDPRRLTGTQRVTLAIELRKRYHLTVKQLAALVRLPKTEVEKYIL